MTAQIEIPTDVVADFCQRNKIRRLALFGSVLREDFAPESDVDVLVEFQRDARVGYFALGRMEIELGTILGRKVDMCTFGGVENNPNWLLREEILGTAEAVYDQAG
jgi:predicted nucleotidyltransferase